jgi:hypothetical protein
MAVLALRLQPPLCVAACDDVYCLIVWSHFFTLDDQSVGSQKKRSIGGFGDCEVMCAVCCCDLIPHMVFSRYTWVYIAEATWGW